MLIACVEGSSERNVKMSERTSSGNPRSASPRLDRRASSSVADAFFTKFEVRASATDAVFKRLLASKAELRSSAFKPVAFFISRLVVR